MAKVTNKPAIIFRLVSGKEIILTTNEAAELTEMLVRLRASTSDPVSTIPTRPPYPAGSPTWQTLQWGSASDGTNTMLAVDGSRVQNSVLRVVGSAGQSPIPPVTNSATSAYQGETAMSYDANESSLGERNGS